MNLFCRRRPRGAALAILFAGVLCGAGCSRSPKPADSGEARKTLTTTLDAWKDGKEIAAHTKNSSIHAVDPQWSGGFKLRGYEITGEEASGNDLKFQVKLRLEDKNGNGVEESAAYSVNTAPKRVVIRFQDF